jgi:hypothetical protein
LAKIVGGGHCGCQVKTKNEEVSDLRNTTFLGSGQIGVGRWLIRKTMARKGIVVKRAIPALNRIYLSARGR